VPSPRDGRYPPCGGRSDARHRAVWQFDEDTTTWRALAEAAPDYPLAKAILFKLGSRWPEPLDFVDPSPDIVLRMQSGYPATAYILRVAPTEPASRGFYRRWVPRVPWRDADSTDFVGLLTLLEIAQTVMANVYMGAVPSEAYLTGQVQPTCWHEGCPVFPTGLCRSWDAIPPTYADCEFSQTMPRVLGHRVDPNGQHPVYEEWLTKELSVPQKLVITADQDALQELASALQNDDAVNPADVEYTPSEVPGQAGEPITIAVIIILVAKGAATGTGVFAGKKLSESVWNRLTRWHSRHGGKAHYAVRDDDGTDHAVAWQEVSDEHD